MVEYEQIRKRLNTDPFALLNGVSVTEIGDGFAVAEAEVTGKTVNTIDTAHGGLIFAVADEAFAAASNSDNMTRVAQQISITFVRPANIGVKLIATARRITQTRNTAVYQIEVRNDDDKVIAACQCLAHSLRVPYIVEDKK